MRGKRTAFAIAVAESPWALSAGLGAAPGEVRNEWSGVLCLDGEGRCFAEAADRATSAASFLPVEDDSSGVCERMLTLASKTREHVSDGLPREQ